jgi:hypothetical protein
MFKHRIVFSLALGITLVVLVSSGVWAALAIQTTQKTPSANAASSYTQRFLTMYNKIKDPINGYFSPQGIPYHSAETLIVEAPDYGHETTSETFSYWLWLEATYGKVTGDWQPFINAWAIMDKYMIPAHSDQPSNSGYTPSSPAQYAPESSNITDYPTQLSTSVTVGQDPLAAELQQAYGNADIYGMPWLLDTDNWYGYGHCGDGTTKPSFVNSYQRGASESVWETVPHPECETFTWGRNDKTGFLSLFNTPASGGTYSQQWRYTDAPDADARVVQAAYWAYVWATAQGKGSSLTAQLGSAAKMGDYLRYGMYDKYFKALGCQSTSCPAGTGKNSSTYLLNWYYSWGGGLPPGGSWAWRIGASSAHQGYQNPLAAWALSSVAALKPKGATATTDWATSLTRQLEFYRWLQSTEGAIAGGATNSWDGQYAAFPAGTPTFYGMAYDVQPVYHDPPSNQWFGFQAWSMERVAEYYYATGNATAKALLDKWVAWASANTKLNADGTYAIPSTLSWSGKPDTWDASNPGGNASLHVSVVDTTNDVGVAAALAKTLLYYSAKAGNSAARTLGQALLDRMAALYTDSKGISNPESRKDYNRFNDPISIPAGWTGTNAQGATINSSTTFLSLRPKYVSDPNWSKVDTYLKGGAVPSFTYHRFWAQADIAIANAVVDILFDTSTGTPTPASTSSITPTIASSPTIGVTPTIGTTPTVGATPSATPTTSPATSCKVQYAVASQWNGGFSVNMVVTNTGSTAISGGWTLQFSFAGNQQITQLWNASYTQSGQQVTLTNASWNGSIASGSAVYPGFLASWSGSNSAPTSFKLNGVDCGVG